jgi:di/tricarboxylate transporter
LVLIGSALGVARAMDESGAAEVVGRALVELTQSLGPRATLAGVYVMGVIFASFISNAAAAALLFPVAMTAAEAGGFDPRPFAMALALAASAGFSTPIGSPANLLVYGPGGYRYRDFIRVGLPLNVIFFVIAIALVPTVWPF